VPILLECQNKAEAFDLDSVLRQAGYFSTFHWPQEMVEFVNGVRNEVRKMGISDQTHYIRVRPEERGGNVQIRADIKEKKGGRFVPKAVWICPPANRQLWERINGLYEPRLLGGGGRQDRCRKKDVLYHRIFVIVVIQVVVRQEKEMYIVENVSSGNNLLLPNIADRWQGTAKRKAKLESLDTRTPYQLWTLQYSEQSHVEDERETHGNMNNDVRIVIVTLVLVLLCVPIVTSNAGYFESAYAQKIPVNRSDGDRVLSISLCQSQFGLNYLYGCRDNPDGRGDSSLLWFSTFHDIKCEKIGESFLLDTSCTDAHDSGCHLMYPAPINVRKCGQFSERVLFDMSCTAAYETGGVLNDHVMLKLQIIVKLVQSSTGGFSCR
jgi:hypothetical protein